MQIKIFLTLIDIHIEEVYPDKRLSLHHYKISIKLGLMLYLYREFIARRNDHVFAAKKRIEEMIWRVVWQEQRRPMDYARFFTSLIERGDNAIDFY